MIAYREEYDSIGARMIPADAYYGVQSLRGAENFRITGRMLHPEFIRAIAEIKKAAAMANKDAGVLASEIANAIVVACDDILNGKLVDSFITDAIQGGAGTSANMNANEDIANRAIEVLGGKKGDYKVVHPNDHVNCGQSTNDVIPSAGRIALIRLIKSAAESLVKLRAAFESKAAEYAKVIKMGRTEMQDAVPISFGQVFGAYASALARDIRRFELAAEEMSVLNLGGTAVGTGINAHPDYSKKVVPTLCGITGLGLVQSDDLVDATQNLDSFVFVSGIVKSCAVTLSKISNDIRLMSSGPRTGFGEINIPAKQNGSSIMPGKINPVMPEVMSQIAYNIIGNDTTITLSAESGQLELNACEPVLFYRLFESLDTLRNGVEVFRTECVEGITVNVTKCRDDLERSITLVTALCPHIGYTQAARIAKRALVEGRNIRHVLIEERVMSAEKIDEILDPSTMI
ncbi:MAG: aspartate ammonia-lyase [Clostridia bacterium]|nr:aspartate ammonia-lyase [Clostridia bacterium]